MTLSSVDVLIGLAVVLTGLSLVVTLGVQTVVACGALRGRNLRQAIEALLREIHPKWSEDEARQSAREVRSHPLLTDTALPWREPLAALPVIGVWFLAKVIRSNELLLALRNVSARPTVLPAAATTMLEKALVDAKGAAAEVVVWFDAMSERATQRFVTKTRLITVVLAFALASWPHFDVLDLHRRLRTDPSLVSALVAAAEPMLERARGEERSAADLAYEDLGAFLEVERERKPARVPTSFEPPEAAEIADVEGAAKWLRERADPMDEADALESDFRSHTVKAQLRRVRGVASDVEALFSGAGLELLPNRERHGIQELFASARHLEGVLLGGLLLSLGAPFWFHLLQSLVNLRPSLAKKEAEERAER